MKFERSLFEEQFDEYWKNKIIALDLALRNTSLGLNASDQSSRIAHLIETFQKNVFTILLDLDRQANMFEDTHYLQEYKNRTINRAVEYLYFYASVFPEYKDISSDFLKTIGIKSFLETVENIPPYPFSSSYEAPIL